MKLLEQVTFDLGNRFTDRIQKEGTSSCSALWMIFQDTKLLVYKDTMLPCQTSGLSLQHSVYMGIFQNLDVFVGEIGHHETIPQEAMWSDLKALYGKIDEAFLALAGRASQLILWEKTHQYCGQCGEKTIDRPNERAKECPSCKLLSFPKISPVVMALVQKDDEILLARGPQFPKGFYSVIAGFVDPGESLESCVRREVFEEVGIEVEDIKYLTSQPWPFPSSLMIGFTCKWKSGEIRIDPLEIEDARWFKKDNLPIIPEHISISRALIDSIFPTH